MTLADTSVIVDFLRQRDPRLKHLFATVQVAICSVTVAEILHGARDQKDLRNLEAALAAIPRLSFAEHLWDAAGVNLYVLRKAGVAVPFPDVLLATLALEHDVELWSRDNQFQLIQSVLPALRLFQEPP